MAKICGLEGCVGVGACGGGSGQRPDFTSSAVRAAVGFEQGVL